MAFQRNGGGGFNKRSFGGDKGRGAPRFTGKSPFKRGDRDARPDMHSADCATCGNRCEVPFRPDGSRPIYCRDCFSAEGGSDRTPRESRSFGNSSARPERRDFAPRNNAPSGGDGKVLGQLLEEMRSMNESMRTLVQVLKPTPKAAPEETASDEKPAKKKVAKKKAK